MLDQRFRVAQAYGATREPERRPAEGGLLGA